MNHLNTMCGGFVHFPKLDHNTMSRLVGFTDDSDVIGILSLALLMNTNNLRPGIQCQI